MQPNRHIASEHVATCCIEGEAIEDRERVGGNRGTQPLDDVAVVIIMRRLDQHHVERLLLARGSARAHPPSRCRGASALSPSRLDVITSVPAGYRPLLLRLAKHSLQ